MIIISRTCLIDRYIVGIIRRGYVGVLGWAMGKQEGNGLERGGFVRVEGWRVGELGLIEEEREAVLYFDLQGHRYST